MTEKNCIISTANTAESRCRKFLLRYYNTVITPMNAFYTGLEKNGQQQSFYEWLWAGIHAANPFERFYPFPEIRGVEDSSTEKIESTDDYGETTTIADGNFGFVQKFRTDYCLINRLVKFNNQIFRVLIFDNKNDVGIIRNSNGHIAGMQMKVFTTHPKANTATEISMGTITYSATSSGEMGMFDVISPDGIRANELKGLEDINMNILRDNTNLIITFRIACSNDDVTAELQELATGTGGWLVQTGNAAPTPLSTAPTYDPNTRTFRIPTSSVTGDKLGIANPFVLFNDFGIQGKELVSFAEVPQP